MSLVLKNSTHLLRSEAGKKRNPTDLPLQPKIAPHWSDQLLGFTHQTFYQLTDQAFLGPMMAAQGAFGLGRWGLLRIFSQSLTPAALIGANVGAFALEGLAFVGTERSLSNAPSENLGKELGHTYLTMTLLRGWGKIFKAAPQAASMAGVFTSHTLAPYLGLGKYMEPMDRLIQSGVTTLHFGIAGHLLHRIPGYSQFQQQIQRKTQEYLDNAMRGPGDSSRLAPVTGGARISAAQPNLPSIDFSAVKMDKVEDEGFSTEKAPPPLEYQPKSIQLDAQLEISRTLHSFLKPKPSFSRRLTIPKLTAERILKLEGVFERGGSISMLQGKPWLIELPNGSETTFATMDVPREDILFYWLWKNNFGFTEMTKKGDMEYWNDNSKRSKYWGKIQNALDFWGKIQKKAQGLGIQISQGLTKEGEILNFGGQIRFIHQMLDLLPDSLLKTPTLKGISLLTERKQNTISSAFHDHKLFLYYGTFLGSRRNLVGTFLRGLGLVTENRYLFGDQGDNSIPESVRQKMHQAHEIITQHDAMIRLDHRGGPEYHKSYEKNFGRFIAELHLAYVAAGPLLRDHIHSFPKDSEVGKAWNFIYKELQNRIFSGWEYDYSPSFESELKPMDKLLWEPPRVSLVPESSSQGHSNLRSHGEKYRIFLIPEITELTLGRKIFIKSKHQKQVSQEHLKIFRFEDFFFAQDLGSKNGTKIFQGNEEVFSWKDPRRTPSHPIPLMRGDRIFLGGVELEIDFAKPELIHGS